MLSSWGAPLPCCGCFAGLGCSVVPVFGYLGRNGSAGRPAAAAVGVWCLARVLVPVGALRCVLCGDGNDGGYAPAVTSCHWALLAALVSAASRRRWICSPSANDGSGCSPRAMHRA